MKKIFASVMTVLLAGSYFSIANAQDDISNIFKAGVADLNTVANGYLKPAGNSFSAGLGSNWYNTAAVHKTFGFDLTIGAGIIQSPASDQTFSLIGLKSLTPTGSTQAPSFTGKGDGVELTLMQPRTLSNGNPNPLWTNPSTRNIVSFTTPSAVSKYIPTASIQFTIGLPVINDVSIRFTPTVKAKGFETSLWGIGIKHNIKQWIPVVKDLPFDAAVVLAYSKFSLNYAFPTSAQITPDKLVGENLSYAPDANLNDYTTQGMKISASAGTANLVFSKKLAFITPYIGFGVTSSNFDLTMEGNYPTLGDPKTHTVSGVSVPDLDQNGKPIMQIKNIADPVKISSSEVMTNATLGLRLKLLGVIAFHAQYAFQKYPVASAGFGLTFR
ncbi:MAG: hypothetical protein Q8904_02685 [Bacteroidota bacterium]|nr:hypothetical protein [Bacteroidota bacterium]